MTLALVALLLLTAQASAETRLLTLHAPDHRQIIINPAQITNMRESREGGDRKKLVTSKTECVITFTDGRFLSVLEECVTVRELIERAKRAQ